jgi:hypothetical protein
MDVCIDETGNHRSTFGIEVLVEQAGRHIHDIRTGMEDFSPCQQQLPDSQGLGGKQIGIPDSGQHSDFLTIKQALGGRDILKRAGSAFHIPRE